MEKLSEPSSTVSQWIFSILINLCDLWCDYLILTQFYFAQVPASSHFGYLSHLNPFPSEFSM